MVTYNNSRQKIGEINVVMRPGEGVVTTVYTLAGPNSFLGFRSGLVSPTTRRPAPSLRSGRLIDSMLRCASKVGAFILYIYGLLPEGCKHHTGFQALHSPFRFSIFLAILGNLLFARS
jgi:hypothetical protein